MPPVPIDTPRLTRMLEELREIGRTPDGGVERLAYTDADVAGRAQVAEWMESAGLTVRIDTAGNMIGRRTGTNDRLPPIAIGSHTDTVPNGGAYDGSLGVLAAIESVWTLEDRAMPTRHPIEVINFQNEEGGLHGSAAMAGTLSANDLDRATLSGKTLRDGIAFIGGDPDSIQKSPRSPGEIAAYLELHVEQGAVLETAGIDIGVVDGIFGVEQWDVTIQGAANHAGTTPMDQRQDALLAAAELIRTVNDVARHTDGSQVGTVGQIDARPGAPNVIAGNVTLCIELRDGEPHGIRRMFDAITSACATIEAATNTTIEMACRELGVLPAPTHPTSRSAIADAARALDLAHQLMPSGACHDAQNLAPICPIGMIFVPSVGGVSHSPEEYTRPEDVENGGNVLLGALLRLDTALD